MAEHAHNPLEASHLIGHVKDADYIELPGFLGGKIMLPQPFYTGQPVLTVRVGFAPIDDRIEPLDLKITKFMLCEIVVAVGLVLILSRVASVMSASVAPRGRLVNFFEAIILFLRDEVVRPAIGEDHHHDEHHEHGAGHDHGAAHAHHVAGAHAHADHGHAQHHHGRHAQAVKVGHPADKFLPFLLTLFFFVLGCNLLGLVPWAGSATGALATTGALAVVTLSTVVFAGSVKLGPVNFWIRQVPTMELPLPLAILLKPMIFGIEVMGLGIKHFILAMRLLANMMAGHLVLAVIMAFIAASAGSLAWWAVTPASLFGALALNMLELFVAFLQAYIFTFLSALFIGMATHPH